MANLAKILSALTCGAVCSIVVTAPARSVSALTITSEVPQNSFVGTTSPSTPLTGPTGYDFTGNGGYTLLTSIDFLRVTLTVQDGDTGPAPGNFDRNNLFLSLDGINTGISLNQLANNTTSTIFPNATPPDNAASILTALQADGRLVGTITDTTPNNGAEGPNGSAGNNILIPASFTTTLEIQGAAVPFEISPGMGSLVLGAWGAIAYFKSNKQKRKFSGSTLSKN